MDPATTKFLTARSYAVLPISPALAALYSSHSSEKNPHWCSKCGSYLLNGSSHVRLVRLKSRRGQPSKRALRTVCQSCQHKVDVTVESEGTQTDVVSPNDLTPTSLPSSSTSTPLISPSHLSASPSSGQESQAQGKARNKKKSGLQLLLLKNREKEMQERKSHPTSGGLAAFLGGL